MIKLRQQIHDLDKRQSNYETYTRERIDSFEKFVNLYIQKNDEEMKAFRESVSRLEERMHNLTIATAIGVATIVVAIVLSR